MKRLIEGGIVALALATAALAAGAGAGQALRNAPNGTPPAPILQAARPGAILPATQTLFDGYVRDGRMPGIVGAFGVGALPPVYPLAGHVADTPGAAAVTPDTLWRVYSMTKPITGMAAMILVEEGRLRLDQPISDFYPGFARMRVLTSPDTSLDSRPATRPITVRHLLTHSAGLGYSIITKGPLLKAYERGGILPAAVDARTEVQMRAVRPATLQAFAERVATLPLIAEPGTKWSYSIGLDVMAAVIERAAGMPFERFVQTRLFDPLRMRSTYWQVPRSQVGRLADNYAWIGDNRVPIDPALTSVFLQAPSFPYGGAGLVTSARDYDRFLHMIANGGKLDGARVMKPETVRLATSNLLPAGVTFGGVGGATGGSAASVPMGFGAGGSVYLADQPGGASKGTYGWGGAAGTVGWVDPVRKVRGTIMVNYFPADKWPLRQQVIGALARDAAALTGRARP